MKNKKTIGIVIVLVLILIYVYFLTFTNNFNGNIVTNYLCLGLIVLIGLYAISLISSKEKNRSFKSKDKLFNLLVENTNTIYVMMDVKTKKVLYSSNNIYEILGEKEKNNSSEQLILNILNLPIILSEIKNWDKKGEYVSQMIEYNNPKYHHQMWIKLKIYLHLEKQNEYYIIQIIDATKEHDRQHLLVTQATDIKARESQLNQITATSYDMEININLLSNTCDLKYFKKDKLYFGEEYRGSYTEFISKIVENFINNNDKEMFASNLNLDNLKDRFNKFELNSNVIRYRLGNEVKNNTWLESTIFFISNRQNSRVSILTKNVTESAESIREQNVLLQNALNDAKMADKSKTNLISTISHDIRTPLTNIMGLSESLVNKNLNEEIKEDIINIKSSSKEVLNIIDGLLDTSKIERKILEKEEKQYSILKMFKIIEANIKEYISNKPLNLNINLDNNLPVILYGDYKRITQAITEIINNSIKYTNEGEINISVRGEKKENFVNLIVEVKDTGIGIEEKKLNSIINSNDSSIGLGKVKDLIKLLDGTLEIESKVNEYTNVKISFKQKIVEDNKIRSMINNNKTAEEFSLKGKRILLVDDNVLNLKVTSRFLESYDVDVTLLESGLECIELIQNQNNFDLIMLDQMMPGLDGLATLNKLKEIKNFKIPVIALTADAIIGQKEKYIENGFSDYISKPIDKSELSRVLKKFLKNNE